MDFAKAFNRMDHAQCLNVLSELGASKTNIDFVAAFLYNRKMAVKVKSILSSPRTVPGGSPQGSILGNFLFCCTTDRFTNIGGEADISAAAQGSVSNSTSDSSNHSNTNRTAVFSTPSNATSTPSSRGQFANFRPPNCLLNLSGEFQSDEEDFEFFRVRNRYIFDSSDEEEDVPTTIKPDTLCPEPVKTMVYIDDFNCIEKVKLSEAESHITVYKRKLDVLAQKSSKVFNKVCTQAEAINMCVNEKCYVSMQVYSAMYRATFIQTWEIELSLTTRLEYSALTSLQSQTLSSM